jgi:hypothetical protein
MFQINGRTDIQQIPKLVLWWEQMRLIKCPSFVLVGFYQKFFPVFRGEDPFDLSSWIEQFNLLKDLNIGDTISLEDFNKLDAGM